MQTVDSNSLRFSHDFRFGGVSFEKFLATARNVCQSISAHRGNIDVEILTAEDGETYGYTTTTLWSEEIEEALTKRKRYSLDELTEDVWNRSLNVQVTVRDKKSPGNFMVYVSCDKHADRKRLKFYGQCLDENTSRALTDRFCRFSLLYGIGNGMTKTSDFNLMMGMRISGIRLPKNIEI